MRTLHVWADASSLAHENCVPGHPESPARWQVLKDALEQVDWPLIWHQPLPATVAQVEQVHAPGYVAALHRHAPSQGCSMLDEDTGMRPGSLQAALLGAGSVIAAVEMAQAGELARAFCLQRPPGHHAEPKRPMGFCLINHVAVGAAHALQLGMKRIAIVDFDVHHGNGTEEMMAERAGVLFYSSFQHPFYPYSGVPPLADNCVSLPLPAGSDGDAFRRAWQSPLAELSSWAPELILVSAGFDAHVRDPLGGLVLQAGDFAWIGRQLNELAKACSAPIVSVLEGGYDLQALCESALVYLQAQL